MFSEVAPVSSFRTRGFAVSLAAHTFLSVAIAESPQAVFVRPSSVVLGQGATSYYIVYDRGIVAETESAAGASRLTLIHSARKTHYPKQLKKTIAQMRQDGDPSDRTATAGSQYGSLDSGPGEGHDVRPAYPIVFPDPPINRGDLPGGLQGEVIVEVTIDAKGNVIATRLLQGVGHGIDEKIMATLKNWHYNPARMDGESISEKHDVHFHIPS